MSYNDVYSAAEFNPNDACNADVHTAGTADTMQVSATAESKDVLFLVKGEGSA